MLKDIIGQNIKGLRKAFNLDKKALANFLSIPEDYLSRYENGKEAIPVKYLEEFCDFYGITLKEISDKNLTDNLPRIHFRKKNKNTVTLKAIKDFNKLIRFYTEVKNIKNENSKT
jgi:transcriptional regulator with XRE-family HTH domain